MNILITGIQGFVGSNLVRALKNNFTLYGLDVITTEMEGVQKIYSNLELKAIPPVDVVIHLAGKTLETDDLSDSLHYFESNAGMTRELFNWFKMSSAKTFIFFSSVKAVAEKVVNAPLVEDVEPKPVGPLGESKLLAEKYILSQFVLDKKVYVLRPCGILGDGLEPNRNLEWMTSWMRKGRPFPFGSYDCVRSFLSIENLIFVLKRLMIMDVPSGVYNLADDGHLSMVEMFEIMGAAFDKKVRIWKINKNLLHLIARLGTRLHWSFNEYYYEKITANYLVSNEKIKKALGVRILPVSTVDGLSMALITQKMKNHVLDQQNLIG